MTPFFSVIICTYNRASLLPRALDSLLAQTEGDWEAIVVDDGSTDDTFEVVQRYAASDARITCVQRDRRGGVAAARNAGITRSTGLFVTFLDSDDAYAEDHLETRKLMLLDRPSTQLLLGGITIIGDPYVVDRFDPTKRVHLDECVVGGTW
jgi:glycosyltransferase involved in cell wall biosynthesis